jgi:hypothetical protein
MDVNALLGAVLKASPVGCAIIAFCFGFWKYLLPSFQALAETRAKIAASEAERAEAARKARDEAWQASLREIGNSQKEATAAAVGGFKDALDRHDRMLDRFSAQNDRLVGDMTSVKTDVAVLRTDVHAVVTKLTTLDGMKPIKPE